MTDVLHRLPALSAAAPCPVSTGSGLVEVCLAISCRQSLTMRSIMKNKAIALFSVLTTALTFIGATAAYLDPDREAPFRDREAWDAMQVEVVELLEGLAA